MKIYISGKITFLPLDQVIEKFSIAKTKLELQGFEVVSPIDIYHNNPVEEWDELMLNDIRELFKCDAIYMLPDWEDSKGARIEHGIAKAMKLIVIFEE